LIIKAKNQLQNFISLVILDIYFIY